MAHTCQDESLVFNSASWKLCGLKVEVGHLPPQRRLLRRVKSKAVRLQAACLRTVRGKQPPAINQQDKSPLFRLPQEIRDQVWKYAFIPTHGAKKVHFHVYEDVYNSCTYEDHQAGTSLNRAYRRLNPTQMSLLITCRAIHNEALQFLYDSSRFALVLLPGFARPIVNLKQMGCRRVGTLQNCQAMFRRMRDITIVIQPGEKPLTSKYTARIIKLLEVLDFGRQARKLSLQFNGHLNMPHYDLTYERRGAIADTFAALGQPLAANMLSKKLKLELRVWTLDQNGGHHPKLFELQHALGNAKITEWHPIYRGIGPIEDTTSDNYWCLQRGAYGSHQNWGPYTCAMSAKEKRVEDIMLAITATTFFLTLPVSVVLTCAGLAVHKRRKGEW